MVCKNNQVSRNYVRLSITPDLCVYTFELTKKGQYIIHMSDNKDKNHESRKLNKSSRTNADDIASTKIDKVQETTSRLTLSITCSHIQHTGRKYLWIILEVLEVDSIDLSPEFVCSRYTNLIYQTTIVTQDIRPHSNLY